MEQGWNLGEEGDEILFRTQASCDMDEDSGLIRRTEVTTAEVHDRQVDLANEGEVRYADKGLFRREDERVRCCHEKSHKGPTP